MKIAIYLIIGASLLLAVGCAKKNQCNTCTVTTTNSVSGESTKSYTESDNGDCEMTQQEYRDQIDLEADLRDLNAQLQDFSGNTTQIHTLSCSSD